ncbi:L-threonylcarbamoyladenylate synthase [Bordetella avium]|uniref:L-threonylcarbamoyladenylate synthase n=1 Tax=Bordetella avium TaxID=521 RepID=UPI000E0C1E96|nr:L-threonylcarbamoyladenylate synthase [Bordetella avium]AZY48414.1 threonylcarbamoyl-AMP synthase [Bordetella avium]AZY51792.1 threonylcarbamoyl-AMP synthase [Bordetella avium]RIQ13344.1 threonylcarbamoyl-AMP synthase [Bordetella avium]RIQ16402.1 threonylcarbamoyl-AMP synthase [Bordetella avium]RIQ31088.1 threonylcarbamoyl-AMP synthase [Bordetella avium]
MSDAQIQAAARRLLEGGLVAFPTETVYGLGADAENAQAVAGIYAAKGRPANHPVIVHIAPQGDPGYWASEVPPEASKLIEAFWPGPLTLILKRRPGVGEAVSGGQDSIGIRCPSHPVAQALLAAFAAQKPGGQGGVAAPSANTFGHVSPTLAAHVRSEFPREVAAGMPVLDGGASEVGIESTILDLSRLDQGMGPVLLRPGHISAEQIAQVLGVAVRRPDAAAPRASGTLKAHYAPRTPLELVDRASRPLGKIHGRIALVAYSWPPQEGDGLIWHRVPADPARYAQALYATLRELDAQGYERIWVEAPPTDAAWDAVNDRIGRAAAAFSLDTSGLAEGKTP